MSFAREVWETFSSLNVNDHTEKKGSGNFQLTYLSWTWALKTLFDHYPESSFEFEEDKVFPDGTVEVAVNVTVREGDQSLARRMWLPVMDHKNASIINPSSRHRSDAKQRCLVKCLALFGLGLYIYAGEDLPDAEKDKAENRPFTNEQREAYIALVKSEDALGLVAFLSGLSEEAQIALHNAFDAGEKSKLKAQSKALESQGFSLWGDIVTEVTDAIIAENGHDIAAATCDLNQLEKRYLAHRLGKEKMAKVAELMNEAKAA